MSLASLKALVRRYFVDARDDPAVCDEIFAPTFRFHAIHHATCNQVVDSSPQHEKDAYAWLDRTWGSWKFIIDEMIAEGDRVMVRWTFTGVQQGEYYGLPPTGQEVSYCGINIFRIADNRIAEVWDFIDRLWLWQQLGVLPDLKTTIGRVAG
jgi:predicted ester cyclase